MHRRKFLVRGAAGLGAAAGLAGSASAASPVRVGIVGTGNRGKYLLHVLLGIPGAQVKAVCDLKEESARQAAEIVRKAGGRDEPAIFCGAPDAYERMLERDDVDAVLIATPTRWHCPMAIQAMKAGKHVASEVPAGFELEELWELVRTKEATGRRYMLLENYAYTRANLMMLDLVRSGLLGDPYYAECGYIHDCRFMLFRPDGSLDWWGEWAARNHGSDYPTHALGPVSKWLGLNEGDRMDHATSMMTSPRVLKEYATRRFGPSSPQAGIDWALGDFVLTSIHTARGRVIRIDYDVNSPRPMQIHYLLQGTKGVYDSGCGIFLEGSPERWDKIDEYQARYDHACWKREGEAAARAGHAGGDHFVVRDFVEMARQDREPWIDVYDAASWSVVYHCSRKSIDGRSASVEIPDFTGGRWADPLWRKKSLGPGSL
jgi:predicted dehydrogenase